MNKVLSNKMVIFSLVLPGVLLFVFAVLAPIIMSVYYGMTNWNGMGKPAFIGLANFVELLTKDMVFYKSLYNVLLLGVCFVILQHPLCLLFAILLDYISGRLEKMFRVIFFIPCVISLIVTSYMWVNIYNPTFGLLNKVLEGAGLGFLKQQWLGNPELALFSVVFIISWQGFGWGFLIYYTGLKGIPVEMYESAKIDGATGRTLFLKIILPLMTPVIRVCVTLAIIAALKQMETVYLTTKGGPGNTTQVLANYMYVRAFDSFEYGYGNAIAVLFVITCLIVTFICSKLIRGEAIEY